MYAITTVTSKTLNATTSIHAITNISAITSIHAITNISATTIIHAIKIWVQLQQQLQLQFAVQL
jgi:hypothetical protein